jgi:hypothetical protein
VAPVSADSTKPEPAPTGTQPPRVRRARRPPAQPRRRFGLGALIGAIVLVAAIAAARHAWRAYRARTVTLEFVRAGAPVPPIELTFYPEHVAGAQPSPPPPLGRLVLGDATSVTLGRERVPGQVRVRYTGEGIGTGFAYVQLGRHPQTIELHPSGTLSGRIGEAIGVWAHGWRCAGLHAIAGAEVTAMGGGEHGLELATARADADGRFELRGFDASLPLVGLRIRAPGFAIAHESVPRVGASFASPLVALARGEVVRGRVSAPAGLDVTSLRVLARGLAGVEAVPAADGAFVLDHVPQAVAPRLSVFGLPPGHIHAAARARIGEDVSIEVVVAGSVRGRVVDTMTGAALAGALVWGGDEVAVRADATGRFTLELPPGAIEIGAQFEDSQRCSVRTGARRVTVPGGAVLDNVTVNID